jgi:hypothetical protein
LGMTMKRSGNKVPTIEEFSNYNGGATHNLWHSLPQDWHCPGCGRSRFELLTWTKSRTGWGVPKGQFQWLVALHKHHDHGADGLFNKGPLQPPRFPATIICSNCNSADANAKKQLNLPSWFSFSPEELRQFLTAHPHNGVVIDLEKAANIFRVVVVD